MIIERAKDADFQELKDLWSIVFDEEPEFLEKFFSLRFSPENIFVARDQGKIVSALHALPSFYHKDNAVRKCAFIVGAATYTEYRKKGIMSHLLTYCKKNLDCPVTLFPAVRPFYEKNGYTTTSEMLRFDLTEASLLQAGEPVELCPKELDGIYMQATAASGALMRDSLAWQFLLDGYDLLSVRGAYAFTKDNIAVEAMAIDEESARNLIGLMELKTISACTVLYDSPFTSLLSENRLTLIPMGMSTASFMKGCYIAEQY
jgi:GNAT superfamily N-acetyltransferase